MVAPITIDEIAAVGPLYAPQGDRPVPTVMILHGAEGAGSGWSHRFAAILAAYGIAAVPYSYGAGDVFGAGDIRDVDVSAVFDAGARLALHARVAGLGLLGWSRGGELAMILAGYGGTDLPFRAIAAHAPADRVMSAFDVAAFRDGGMMVSNDHDARRAWVWDKAGVPALAPGTPIPAERFSGPVFLSVGDRDEVWDHAMTLRLAERRRAAGCPTDLWIAVGQGHALDFAAEPELWGRLESFFAAHLAPGRDTGA